MGRNFGKSEEQIQIIKQKLENNRSVLLASSPETAIKYTTRLNDLGVQFLTHVFCDDDGVQIGIIFKSNS